MSPWTRHEGAPRTLRYEPWANVRFRIVAVDTGPRWAAAAHGDEGWTAIDTETALFDWLDERLAPWPTLSDLVWLTENSNRTKTR